MEPLAQLSALLATPPGTVIITAAPGTGKTALAVHWGHRVRHLFHDGDLYVGLRGYDAGPALDAAHALDSFLRALDIPPEAIPGDRDGRAALYRSALSGRRMLVVIGNASAAGEVRPLLPASPGCLTIVTSRNQMSGLVVRDGATRVTLDVLSAEEALNLLRQIVGAERIDAEPAAAAEVAARCGYLPLALRVVAERLALRPHLALRRLSDELADERERLDVLGSDDEPTDVRAVFSWSYRALSPGG